MSILHNTYKEFQKKSEERRTPSRDTLPDGREVVTEGAEAKRPSWRDRLFGAPAETRGDRADNANDTELVFRKKMSYLIDEITRMREELEKVASENNHNRALLNDLKITLKEYREKIKQLEGDKTEA